MKPEREATPEELEALKCPRCYCKHSKVLETRNCHVQGGVIRVRVRQCRNCNKQFRSKEVTDQSLTLPSESRSLERKKEKDPEDDYPEAINPFLPPEDK